LQDRRLVSGGIKAVWRWHAMIVLLTLLGDSAVYGQSRQGNWKQCLSADPERSIAVCSTLIQSGQETGADLAKVFDSRGLAYARKRDFDRAIQDYDQSLQLNSDSATAHYNRGVAYEFKGDYDRAFPDLDRAVQLNPGDADSFFCRGLAFEHGGDYERAVQDFDHVLRMSPTYSAALYNRALSNAHKGAYLSALADYGRWRRLKSGPLGLVELCVVLGVLSLAAGYLWRSWPHSRRTNGDESHFTTLFPDETASSRAAKRVDQDQL